MTKSTEQTIILYHVPNSYSNITQDVLAELEINHETKIMHIREGDTSTSAFLKLNPNGRVPVLVHDGMAIWESSAITLHLGETFGVAKGLFPKPGPLRGQCMTWIIWASVVLAEASRRLAAQMPADSKFTGGMMSKDFIPANEQSHGVKLKAQGDLIDCLGVLNSQLEGKQYVVGETYLLVDTHLSALVGWIQKLEVNFDGFPNILSWQKRCSSRPLLFKT